MSILPDSDLSQQTYLLRRLPLQCALLLMKCARDPIALPQGNLLIDSVPTSFEFSVLVPNVVWWSSKYAYTSSSSSIMTLISLGVPLLNGSLLANANVSQISHVSLRTSLFIAHTSSLAFSNSSVHLPTLTLIAVAASYGDVGVTRSVKTFQSILAHDAG